MLLKFIESSLDIVSESQKLIPMSTIAKDSNYMLILQDSENHEHSELILTGRLCTVQAYYKL